MTKKIITAIIFAAAMSLTNANAEPSTQHVGMCSSPQVHSEIIDYLDKLWVGIAEINETRKRDPETAEKLLSAQQIAKIKNGTYSRIIETYARTTDNKLPADCLAIIKSTITSANKTVNVPTYPMNFDVYQKKDGTIDIHIDNKSIDMDLIKIVADSLVLWNK